MPGHLESLTIASLTTKDVVMTRVSKIWNMAILLLVAKRWMGPKSQIDFFPLSLLLMLIIGT